MLYTYQTLRNEILRDQTLRNQTLRDQTSEATGGQTDEELSDFISDEAQTYINIYLMSVAGALVGLLGMGSNIINFTVLIKQGIKDCVSLCLLSLTFSDFFVAFLMLAGSVCYTLSLSGWYFYVDPLAVNSAVSWTWGMLFDISMLTTAFISVERCLSVLLPFRFKNLVTFHRAQVALFCIYTVTAGGYMALFLTQGLSVQWDSRTNTSRVLLWMSDNRVQVEAYTNIAVHLVYGTFCEIIVISSTLGMISGLHRSNQFRSRSAKTEAKDNDSLSQRNKKIVKMVAVLAGIFIVCNVIRLLFNYVRLAFPEIMLGKSLHNTFVTFLRVLILCGTVGASLNTFVYYFCKPSFKRVLLSFFCKSPATPVSGR